MAWYLRAVERDDGAWQCCHGIRVFDAHDELPDALNHLHHLAGCLDGESQFFAHFRDGRVETF